MDAEKLRDIYNVRFGAKTDWTSSDRKKTQMVVKKLLKRVRDAGVEKKNLKVLDVGCAEGNFTESFRLLGCESTGLDYSEVGIGKAREKYRQCSFLHMNGFEPDLPTSYDIIFCRGFSGFNTHDLNFIAAWANRYVRYLSVDGILILGFSSNFSGFEKGQELVNHSKEELQKLTELIEASYLGTYFFNFFGWLSHLKKKFEQLILRKDIKWEYYILLRKLRVHKGT